jgi:drug/metabolite transporter (DMT)-like permease
MTATGSGILVARPVIGASAMMLNTILIPIMGVAIKMLTAADYTALEMLSWRSLLVLAVLLPVLAIPQHRRAILAADVKAHLIHGAFAVSSMYCFYYALRTLPIVTVTTINFTTPIFTLILARILLSEKISALGYAAVVMGFLGAVLVLRPDTDGIGADALIVLLGSVLSSAMQLTIRRMPARSTNFAAIFYLSLFGALVFVPLGGPAFRPPASADWVWLLVLTTVALDVHSCVIIAFRFASTILIGALDYLRIVTAFAFGLLVFGEQPDRLDVLGIAVIVFSGAVVLHSSGRRRPVEPSV